MSKLFFAILLFAAIVFATLFIKSRAQNIFQNISTSTPTPINSLSIQYLRGQSYSGSDVKIERELTDGSNYKRYISSFQSGGLKEYAYLTIPKTQKPIHGYPVIIFNHGYQTPELYTPDGNYIAYMDAIAKAGYIIFKPDYRGNGKSQGAPTSAYFSSDYDIDDLNAIASIKKFPDADPDKIGIWGHSMGGNITFKVSEISKDLKVAVIWGGVVGNYNDIIYNWQGKVSYQPSSEDLYLRNLGLSEILAKNGSPNTNPNFWNLIDPTSNLNFVNIPFQFHVGASDNQVPVEFSESLYKKMKQSGKNVEFYEYAGANHDIAQSFILAMTRTIAFFDKYLK